MRDLVVRIMRQHRLQPDWGDSFLFPYVCLHADPNSILSHQGPYQFYLPAVRDVVATLWYEIKKKVVARSGCVLIMKYFD